jgi:hypothetical protein
VTFTRKEACPDLSYTCVVPQIADEKRVFRKELSPSNDDRVLSRRFEYFASSEPFSITEIL